MAEATSNFVQITGCSRQQASDYLNSTGFDLQRAVRNYFSTLDSQRCPEQRDECALPDSFNVATWNVETFGMARFVEFIKGLEWPIAFVRNVTIEQLMNFAPLLVDDYYILIANPSAERHLVCIASKQWPFTRFASRTGNQLGTVDVEVRVQKGAIALVHGALVEDVGDAEAQRELARLLFNTQLMMSFPPAAPTHYITSINGRDVSVFGQHHAPFEVATSICGTPVPVFFGGPYVPCEAADPDMVFGPMAVYAEQLPDVVCFERAGAGPDQEEERAKGME